MYKWSISAVVFSAMISAASLANAQPFANCTVSDPQFVQQRFPQGGFASSFAFRACGVTWIVPSETFSPTAGGRGGQVTQAQDVVMSAFDSGRRINVVCGGNGQACPSRFIDVFEGTGFVNRQAFEAQGVSLLP